MGQNEKAIIYYKRSIELQPNLIASHNNLGNILRENGNLKEASRNLFHFLHKLDQSKCKKIAIAPIPNVNLGLTINDRIKRASKK